MDWTKNFGRKQVGRKLEQDWTGFHSSNNMSSLIRRGYEARTFFLLNSAHENSSEFLKAGKQKICVRSIFSFNVIYIWQLLLVCTWNVLFHSILFGGRKINYTCFHTKYVCSLFFLQRNINLAPFVLVYMECIIPFSFVR